MYVFSSHIISLARLIQIHPEMATEKGLDGVFTERGNKEDIVLWSMLDAWKETGLPKTDALSRIEIRETDERTRAVFLKSETPSDKSGEPGSL